MELLIAWLHRGLKLKWDEGGCDLRLFIYLYILADEWCLSGLKNLILKILGNWLDAHPAASQLAIEEVIPRWNSFELAHTLRDLLAHRFIMLINRGSCKGVPPSVEVLHRACKMNALFAADVAAALWRCSMPSNC